MTACADAYAYIQLAFGLVAHLNVLVFDPSPGAVFRMQELVCLVPADFTAEVVLVTLGYERVVLRLVKLEYFIGVV